MDSELTAEGISQEERMSVAMAACADPVLFCKFFLPHLFTTDMPWVHRALLAILTKKTQFLFKYGELDKICRNFVYTDQENNARQIFSLSADGTEINMNLGRFTLIMMPRGFSKTTLAGIAVPLYNILFETTDFTLYVSEAGPHAKMQLDNVKRELNGNDRILAIFGPMKPKLSDDERWSQDLFETVTGVAMAARGRGSQVRGLNHRGRRPKQIICDDLEDRESVETDAQRLKVRTWAYGDLTPALADLEEDSTIVALGTMLHKECLLQVWANDPKWTVVKLGAHDLDGEPLWSLLMDDEAYASKKQSFALAGMLHIFYMEYENEYRAPELQIFKEQNMHITIPESSVVATAIYIDPAISDDPDADWTVIIVASTLDNGMIRVRDCWMKQGAHPREQIDQYFMLSKIWEPQKHGVETNSYQKALAHLLKEEMGHANYFFEVTCVPHYQKKDKRIRGILAPRFASDYITFDRKFPILEAQFLDYPSGKKDGPDALAGCVALLDDYAGLARDDADPFVMNEYEPLEKVMGGDWRWAH